jgi:hypothetical protein
MRPHTPSLLAVVALALAAVLTACGASGLGSARTTGPGFEAEVELTRSGGCGEAYLWAATEDGTVVVTVSVEVPRYSTREPVVVDVDLADPEVEAVLLRGDADLTRNLCVDVIESDAEPDETVPLTAGTGELVVGTVPTDVPTCGNVTGTLDLTAVEADDGTRIPEVTAETDAIGCYAG